MKNKTRREAEFLRQVRSRLRIDPNKTAFNYYEDYYVAHCRALKFYSEKPGMRCSTGEVNLPILSERPEPLQTYIAGATQESKHF